MRVLLKRPWFTALGMFRPNENPDDGTTEVPDSLRQQLPTSATIIDDTAAHKLAEARRLGQGKQPQTLAEADLDRAAANQVAAKNQEAEDLLASRKAAAEKAKAEPVKEPEPEPEEDPAEAEDDPAEAAEDPAEAERKARAAAFQAELEAQQSAPTTRRRKK